VHLFSRAIGLLGALSLAVVSIGCGGDVPAESQLGHAGMSGNSGGNGGNGTGGAAGMGTGGSGGGGQLPSDIGAACTRPADPMCQNQSPSDQIAQGSCGAGERCVSPDGCAGGWPGGYCSKKCGADNMADPGCPADSACIDIGNQTRTYRCLRKCTTHQDCRLPGMGYACSPTKTATVCMVGYVCEQKPAMLPFGDFTRPNLMVPAPTPSLLESEGNVSLDGLGHVAIAQTGIYQGGDVMAAAVYTEGQGFHTPVAYAEYPTTNYTSDPVVAYDAEAPGTTKPLYLVWLNIDVDASHNPSNSRVMIAKSLDNGATFHPPSMPSMAAAVTHGQDISGTDGNGFIDKPWVVASNNKIYVTYGAFNGTGEKMVYSEDGGAHWSTPRSISPGGGFQNFGQPAVATQTGDVFVTFTSGGITAARWRRSHSQMWFDPAVTIAGSDNVANPSGIAVSRDGTHLWAAWDDGTDKGSNVKVAVARNAATSTTLTFSPAVTVNDDQSCGDHIHATVAVDSTGKGHVAWLDNRYSSGIVEGVVHYAVSNDTNGTSFTTPVVVSDTTFPFTTSRVPGLWLGDYIGIATAGSKVHVAWADPRGGTRTHFYYASRTR
jgi:hypothetical protein